MTLSMWEAVEPEVSAMYAAEFEAALERAADVAAADGDGRAAELLRAMTSDALVYDPSDRWGSQPVADGFEVNVANVSLDQLEAVVAHETLHMRVRTDIAPGVARRVPRPASSADRGIG